MYTVLYANAVRVNITEFRKNLFKLADRVIAGETVEFVYRNSRIQLVMPETNSSKLDRLTPRKIVNPKLTEKQHQAADRKLQKEIQAELAKDWAEI